MIFGGCSQITVGFGLIVVGLLVGVGVLISPLFPCAIPSPLRCLSLSGAFKFRLCFIDNNIGGLVGIDLSGLRDQEECE
jgi:hypothetical protein